MATCSQCARREIPCRLDDSDDVRIRRRRQVTDRGDIVEVSVGESQMDVSNTSLGNRRKQTSQVASESNFVSLSTGDSHMALSNSPYDLFADDPFALSSDNMLFLDQVFMGDCEPTEWNNHGPSHGLQGPPSTSDNTKTDSREKYGRVSIFPGGALDSCSWMGDSADAAIYTAALRSYFDSAAPYLPILLADAFWQDYHANRCSELLLYAVTCCGMPFTGAPNKWDLQQRLACKFRETFLTARSNETDNESIRLDDLEALALMVNFEYEDVGSLPLLSNLGRLFLTHESLVLMTINYRILDCEAIDSTSSAKLARASERRVLLYWHVYGLDAFHCLDRKQISRIPNNDVGRNDSHLPHETKDYFDAILALAIVARKITQTLCSPLAKCQGVDPNDVHDSYEQLYHWSNNICPQYLRRYKDSAGGLAPRDLDEPNSSEIKKHTHLYRAVLWALELNCLMQIECCVSDYGIHDKRSLEAETTAIRVEYASVRALNDMVDICQWIKRQATLNQDDDRHSLVDLAPSVLRNACAGLCFWSCQRGIELCNRGTPSLLRSTHENNGDDRFNRHVQTYVEAAQLLRDTAAKASSHRDTAQILERLDKQLALLDSRLGELQDLHQTSVV
ncbi:hypothetical protein N7474_007282 [Penicillium riverlandense]|uniref:uncharacterized protein n=1 Tax=Penicillium riverlandense TaxID=1903569 RepID=UPI0025493699|nr:uncharacterized protein N7474_007282 [Penicillium riverlandense]KAJ5815505.1 hypothetical protein N7474_007282 [Penicillium riverlandense]